MISEELETLRWDWSPKAKEFSLLTKLSPRSPGGSMLSGSRAGLTEVLNAQKNSTLDCR
jgi:hypothetical protein